MVGHGGSIYVFDTSTGERLFAWTNLVTVSISAVLYAPQRRSLLVATTAPEVLQFNVNIATGKVDFLQTLKQSSEEPAALSLNPTNESIMTASPKGRIVLWRFTGINAPLQAR